MKSGYSAYSKGKRIAVRFTLIELLVVISIIAVLAAMLLPVLTQAKTQAKHAVCTSQMKQITVALHMYMDDGDTYMPWMRSAANPSTCQTFPFDPQMQGFAAIYASGYIGDHHILYCPDFKVTGGWGSNPAQGRINRIRTFPSDIKNQKDSCVDYHLSYWGGQPTFREWEKGTGFGRYPAVNGAKSVYWMADGHGVFCYYYQGIAHNNGVYMNLARMDGGVDTIRNWREKQAGIGQASYYKPYNDRPGWGFWRYFGIGLGID